MFNITRIACPPKYQRRRKYREHNNLRASKAPLHLSRDLYKSNLFLQNKANSPGVQDDTTALLIRTYENLWLKISPKNKAKQSQFKPNFDPKLALFLTNEPNLQTNNVKIGNLKRKFDTLTLTKRMRKRSCGRERFCRKSLLFEEKSFKNTKVSEILSVASVNSVAKYRLVQIRVNSWLKISVAIYPFAAIAASGQAELFPIGLFWRLGRRIPVVYIYYRSCDGTASPRKRNLPRVKFHSGSFCPEAGHRLIVGRNNPLFDALRDRLLPVYRVSIREHIQTLPARNTLHLFGDVWFQEYRRPRGVSWLYFCLRRVYLYRLCHHRQRLQRESFFCGILRNRKGFAHLVISAVVLKELFHYPARQRMQERAGIMLLWPLLCGCSLRRLPLRPLASRIVLCISRFYFFTELLFLYVFLFAAGLSSSKARQTACRAFLPCFLSTMQLMRISLVVIESIFTFALASEPNILSAMP